MQEKYGHLNLTVEGQEGHLHSLRTGAGAPPGSVSTTTVLSTALDFWTPKNTKQGMVSP